jgi:intraflagellar transport protein 122
VLIRARPLIDDARLTVCCFRCKEMLPLLSLRGESCSSCGAKIVRSFATFEPLPIVEFELAKGISDDEAKQLLAAEPRQHHMRYGALLIALLVAATLVHVMSTCCRQKRLKPCPNMTISHCSSILASRHPEEVPRETRGVTGQDAGADYLRLEDDDVADEALLNNESDSAFIAQFALDNGPVVADRGMLQNMTVANVLIRRWPNPNVPPQYFWVTDSFAELCVGDCRHIYESIEYESLAFRLRHLPISQTRTSSS